VSGSGFLLLVQRYFDRVCRSYDREGGEQQGVQHLLGNDLEWSPQARGYDGARLALGHMQIDRHMPWEEKLPREEVHLDLAPLAPAVVNHAVHPDWRSFRGASRIDVGRGFGLLFAVPQFRMPDFMRNQERLVER
jgi:hypothetical protein